MESYNIRQLERYIDIISYKVYKNYAKGTGEIVTKILDVVSSVLGTPVSEESKIEDVAGWDSLKTLQIVMALDEAGYEIPLEKIAEIQSVRDILSFARKGE